MGVMEQSRWNHDPPPTWPLVTGVVVPRHHGEMKADAGSKVRKGARARESLRSRK
jgi:hypothetical protein